MVPGRGSKAAKQLPAGVSRIVIMAVVTGFVALLICVRTAHMAFSISKRVCQPPWVSAWSQGIKLKVALVTLSAPSKHKAGTKRDFGGVLEMTRPNKEAYAKKHNYKYIDASSLYNSSRPASWSKLLAVQHHLPDYDWVFWIDADTLITNPEEPLETLLPASGSPDYVLTKDGGGYNAGVWFMRNSSWSHEFLQTWWNMDSFIRRKPGDTKSGDNDALKHYLANMPRVEFAQHVGVAPQCAFNSYVWKPSLMNWMRYLSNPAGIVTGLYRQGDFLLHLAGLDDKVGYIQKYMKNTGH